MAIIYTPSANDALGPLFTGNPYQDPVNYTTTSMTRIDAKFYLKPIQDEILLLIQQTSSLTGSSTRTMNTLVIQSQASMYNAVTFT